MLALTALRQPFVLADEIVLVVRFIGKADEAAQVKALVNIVMNVNTAGLAEGLALGTALGLDRTMLREVFCANRCELARARNRR